VSVPPSPYAYRLSVILAQGDYHQAAHLLESLNRLQRAFGFVDFEMPEPHGPMDGLVTCRADVPYSPMSRDVDPETGRQRIAA
jgi:hypothetical protein